MSLTKSNYLAQFKETTGFLHHQDHAGADEGLSSGIVARLSDLFAWMTEAERKVARESLSKFPNLLKLIDDRPKPIVMA